MISLAATNTLAGKAGTASAITYTITGGDAITTSDAFQILAQGQLGTSATTLYTVPSSTVALINNISLANTTGTAVTGVVLYVNGTAASNQILGGLTIPANGTAVFAEGIWQVYSSTGGVVGSPSGTAGGDLSGTYPNPTVAQIQGVAVTSAQATLVSDLNNSMTRSATATLQAGEETIFTGSTTAQTLTLPVTPQASSINSVTNLSSVSVTLAAGAGNTINSFGVVGSITLLPYVTLIMVFIGTTWYLTSTNNGRKVKRIGSTTSSATPTIDSDLYDMYELTALATAVTSFTTNLSGSPNDGDSLIIKITDNGTAQSLTWGSQFESSTISLPTTTVASTTLTVGFFWNVPTTNWRCVAVA
jgi:hypothetical protein